MSKIYFNVGEKDKLKKRIIDRAKGNFNITLIKKHKQHKNILLHHTYFPLVLINIICDYMHDLYVIKCNIKFSIRGNSYVTRINWNKYFSININSSLSCAKSMTVSTIFSSDEIFETPSPKCENYFSGLSASAKKICTPCQGRCDRSGFSASIW